MERLPPLRLLTTFAEVARTGSMQDAADRLNVTRPAITQAIKALEAHIGVTLLDRSRKPARMTAEGQQLALSVDTGLGMIGTAIEDLQQASRAQEGQLTVSCTLGMATYWLMPRLPQFYALYPDLTVNVQAPPSDLPMLRAGIDVALRYGQGGWQDGMTQELFPERICPVGRPDVIAQFQAQGSLQGAPLIHVTSPDAAHWAGWSAYFAEIDQPMPNTRAFQFDNYVQAVQAALDGRGVMLGWRSITGALVEEGSLTPWPNGGRDLGTGYYMTLRDGSADRLPVAQFAEWVLGQAESTAW